MCCISPCARTNSMAAVSGRRPGLEWFFTGERQALSASHQSKPPFSLSPCSSQTNPLFYILMHHITFVNLTLFFLFATIPLNAKLPSLLRSICLCPSAYLNTSVLYGYVPPLHLGCFYIFQFALQALLAYNPPLSLD